MAEVILNNDNFKAEVLEVQRDSCSVKISGQHGRGP